MRAVRRRVALRLVLTSSLAALLFKPRQLLISAKHILFKLDDNRRYSFVYSANLTFKFTRCAWTLHNAWSLLTPVHRSTCWMCRSEAFSRCVWDTDDSKGSQNTDVDATNQLAVLWRQPWMKRPLPQRIFAIVRRISKQQGAREKATLMRC